jgi:hypothetical protein
VQDEELQAKSIANRGAEHWSNPVATAIGFSLGQGTLMNIRTNF